MNRVEAVARERIAQCRAEIAFSLEHIRQDNPFAGEPDIARRSRRFQSKLHLSPREAQVLNAEIARRAKSLSDESYIPPSRAEPEAAGPHLPEAIWGDTVDFVSVAFLERGARIARTVGRVSYESGRAKGTGVLIGSDLFLTNHHVIENQAQARECVLEFDYERDLDGAQRQPSAF